VSPSSPAGEAGAGSGGARERPAADGNALASRREGGREGGSSGVVVDGLAPLMARGGGGGGGRRGIYGGGV
jgi:hypothetical protein